MVGLTLGDVVRVEGVWGTIRYLTLPKFLLLACLPWVSVESSGISRTVLSSVPPSYITLLSFVDEEKIYLFDLFSY